MREPLTTSRWSPAGTRSSRKLPSASVAADRSVPTTEKVLLVVLVSTEVNSQESPSQKKIVPVFVFT